MPADRAGSALKDAEKVFAALAHPARRQILMTVHFRGGEMSAGEIAARFSHSWATTTGHLNRLVWSGLLVRSRQGRNQLYALDRSRLRLACGWLAWFEGDAAQQTEHAVSQALVNR